MEFIYDRTQTDVDRIKALSRKYTAGTISDEELAEWQDSSKGAINASDMNRNEENMQTIADMIAVGVLTKSWDYSGLPRVSDYTRLLENLAKIRAGYGIMSDTPPVPAQPLNTYQKWNDIEKILHDVHYVYVHVQEDMNYCGEIYAGEGIGVL